MFSPWPHKKKENKYKTCNTITDRKTFFSIFRKKIPYRKPTMHGSYLGNEFENEALSFEDLEKSNKVQNELKNALDVELWRVKRKDLDELCNNSI